MPARWRTTGGSSSASGESASLSLAHEGRIADDVGGKYGRKATSHESLPAQGVQPSAVCDSARARNATNVALWLIFPVPAKFDALQPDPRKRTMVGPGLNGEAGPIAGVSPRARTSWEYDACAVQRRITELRPLRKPPTTSHSRAGCGYSPGAGSARPVSSRAAWARRSMGPTSMVSMGGMINRVSRAESERPPTTTEPRPR